MLLKQNLTPLVAECGRLLRRRQWQMGCVESCTGGLIGALVTGLSGSSAWFQGALVTYSNAQKMALAGVDEDCLAAYGAVSEPTAVQMARGGARTLDVAVCVAVTGVAGPTGGSPEKPLGCVYIAWQIDTEHSVQRYQFSGDRASVRGQTAIHALSGLRQRLSL